MRELIGRAGPLLIFAPPRAAGAPAKVSRRVAETQEGKNEKASHRDTEGRARAQRTPY
jgi:hypothetical protein